MPRSDIPQLGDNGGPPLDDLLSLILEDACTRTGFNETQMRGFIRTRRVRSFKLGKRRYIEAASLRRLVEELAAKAEVMRPQPRRGKRGRWVGPTDQPAAKA
jgi:hypothetical protein